MRLASRWRGGAVGKSRPLARPVTQNQESLKTELLYILKQIGSLLLFLRSNMFMLGYLNTFIS